MPKLVFIFDDGSPNLSLNLLMQTPINAFFDLENKCLGGFLEQFYDETIVNGLVRDADYFQSQIQNIKDNCRKGAVETWNFRKADFDTLETISDKIGMWAVKYWYNDDNAQQTNVFGNKVFIYQDICLVVLVDDNCPDEVKNTISEMTAEIL